MDGSKILRILFVGIFLIYCWVWPKNSVQTVAMKPTANSIKMAKMRHSVSVDEMFSETSSPLSVKKALESILLEKGDEKVQTK